MVHSVRKSWSSIVVLSLFAVSLFIAALPSNAKASPSPSFNVKVQHAVDIRESGMLLINDTITVSNIGSVAEPLQDYVLGFPFNYQSDLAYAYAYKTSNASERLGLDLNVGLGRIGFYAVRVNFVPPVEISSRGQYEFTVVFVFFGGNSVTPIKETSAARYNASFPAYPSLPHAASEVNLKIALPQGFNYVSSSYENDNVKFTNTTVDSRLVLSYTRSNLSEFSDQPAWLNTRKSGITPQLVDALAVDRSFTFTGGQQIQVSETYSFVNKLGNLTTIRLKIPKGAYAIVAFDEFGPVLQKNLKTLQVGAHTQVNITSTLPHVQGEGVHVVLQYNLPWTNYVTLGDLGRFSVTLPLFENVEGVVRELTATVALPEGASLSSPIDSQNLSSEDTVAFSSSFAFTFQNATPFQDLSINFAYQRSIFWESFRPTVWVSAFVVAVGAVAGAWKLYQPPPAAPLPTAIVGVRAEDLKAFVEYYDEKRRLVKEADSLEAAARKGKVPRRQYKVRKKTIDGRLMALSRDLAVSRDKLRSAGPRYGDLMRQLEVAENEQQAADAEINRAEVRYRRGELSAQAYHNVLETAYRRRDKAQTTVDGVLLRIREEIS